MFCGSWFGQEGNWNTAFILREKTYGFSRQTVLHSYLSCWLQTLNGKHVVGRGKETFRLLCMVSVGCWKRTGLSVCTQKASMYEECCRNRSSLFFTRVIKIPVFMTWVKWSMGTDLGLGKLGCQVRSVAVYLWSKRLWDTVRAGFETFKLSSSVKEHWQCLSVATSMDLRVYGELLKNQNSTKDLQASG